MTTWGQRALALAIATSLLTTGGAPHAAPLARARETGGATEKGAKSNASKPVTKTAAADRPKPKRAVRAKKPPKTPEPPTARLRKLLTTDEGKLRFLISLNREIPGLLTRSTQFKVDPLDLLDKQIALAAKLRSPSHESIVARLDARAREDLVSIRLRPGARIEEVRVLSLDAQANCLSEIVTVGAKKVLTLGFVASTSELPAIAV